MAKSKNTSPRVGLYAWGGPGTIRLLHTKYANPRIDIPSFMKMYDTSWLDSAKSTLNVTDMWVTFSWGFSNATEKKDRAFIINRLPLFKEKNIKTYAYIQGTNLVTREFPTSGSNSPFCRDAMGGLLPYSRGRSFTCPNNPRAVAIIAQRVLEACQHDFDTIFIDNIFLGLPAWYYRKDVLSFAGCSCTYCQEKFFNENGYKLPLGSKKGAKVVSDYIAFRTRSLTELISRLSRISRSTGKQFGVNLYDPYWHTSDIMFGYNFNALESYLDYYLIENHHLNRGNKHLKSLLKQKEKPTFVVSYKKGIGFDSSFTQEEINHWWTDAQSLGYIPCLKATEYITNKTWHGIFWDLISTPQVLSSVHSEYSIPKLRVKKSSKVGQFLVPIIDLFLPTIIRKYYSSAKTFALFNKLGIYQKLVHSPKVFEDYLAEV
jgi:hypothetical protein